MACRGICERYRSEKKRYFEGAKRCTCCDVYLFTYDFQCPCCHTLLRLKRKTKKQMHNIRINFEKIQVGVLSLR